MSFAIMRVAKVKAGNICGTDKHNERKNKNYSNEDINTELSHLNYHLIECDSYKSAINKQLEERYTSSRSIRKDAVLGVEVLFTSDNEFFKKLTPEQERLYFEKSLEFLKDFVGEKNVISATVHKDETTPHLHCIFTPITNDGRLHYKSFIDGRLEMKKLQDNYYKFITKYFDLERGKDSQETKRKHLSVEEFKLKELKKDLFKLQNEKKDIEKRIKNLENQITNYDEVKTIVENIEDRKALFSDNYKLKKDELITLSALATSSEKNKGEIQNLKDEKINLEKKLKTERDDNEKNYKELKKLKEFKFDNEYYVKRLETVVSEDMLKTIKEENISYKKIQSITSQYGINLYLQELDEKGFKNLNKVEKEFIYDNYNQKNDIAIDIINKTKNTEKTAKKPVEKTDEWNNHMMRGRGKGFGLGD